MEVLMKADEALLFCFSCCDTLTYLLTLFVSSIPSIRRIILSTEYLVFEKLTLITLLGFYFLSTLFDPILLYSKSSSSPTLSCPPMTIVLPILSYHSLLVSLVIIIASYHALLLFSSNHRPALLYHPVSPSLQLERSHHRQRSTPRARLQSTNQRSHCSYRITNS